MSSMTINAYNGGVQAVSNGCFRRKVLTFITHYSSCYERSFRPATPFQLVIYLLRLDYVQSQSFVLITCKIKCQPFHKLTGAFAVPASLFLGHIVDLNHKLIGRLEISLDCPWWDFPKLNGDHRREGRIHTYINNGL